MNEHRVTRMVRELRSEPATQMFESVMRIEVSGAREIGRILAWLPIALSLAMEILKELD
jgi:hypothetical protein